MVEKTHAPRLRRYNCNVSPPKRHRRKGVHLVPFMVMPPARACARPVRHVCWKGWHLVPFRAVGHACRPRLQPACKVGHACRNRKKRGKEKLKEGDRERKVRKGAMCGHKWKVRGAREKSKVQECSIQPSRAAHMRARKIQKRKCYHMVCACPPEVPLVCVKINLRTQKEKNKNGFYKKVKTRPIFRLYI